MSDVAPEAEAPAESPKTTATGAVIDESTLQAHRTPFEVLSERMIGTASRAVRYDWRKANVQLELHGSQLLELNNFNSLRFGGALRVPVGSLLVELGASWVFLWGSDASNKLSLTPYRQAGRPRRLEVDLLLSYPLAEGVTTPRFSFIPPTELVFMVSAGLRARWYAHELDKMKTEQAMGALFAPRLFDQAVSNLEYARLPGMEIDRSRYDLLVGFSLVVYFQNGAFLAPRVTVSPPVFSGIAQSTMGFWFDLQMALGWSF
ncbi:MAG: hypothetical protein IPJ65_25135 [Archangiaceae bacterium]|nr:hypothetical protein [Archangiaceae bacterium]